MTSIHNAGLLTDTLNLVQLARETALAKGKQEQAKRLSPVVDELKTLVTTRQGTAVAPAPSSTMAQSDFGTLLAVSKKSPAQPMQNMAGNDRNRMVLAMSGGNMAEKDIARQLGMTTDEVKMIVSANQKGQAGVEVRK